MTITWYGQSYFQINTNQGKNERVNIVVDPFDKTIGLRTPKLTADILLITHNHYDHNNIKVVSGNPFLIDGLGEYEIKEVFIQGISGFHDNSQGRERGGITIYIIETEGIRLCHLGDLGQSELTAEQIDKIGNIDILMLPIGGVYTISAKEAIKIISQIEPKIIIPMHYQIPNLKIKLDGVDKFMKVMGLGKIDSLSKLSIKSKDLLDKETKIIILEP